MKLIYRGRVPPLLCCKSTSHSKAFMQERERVGKRKRGKEERGGLAVVVAVACGGVVVAVVVVIDVGRDRVVW